MINDSDALFERLNKLINDANERQTTTIKLEIQTEVSAVKTEITELKKIIQQEKDKVNALEKTQTDLQTKYKILEKSLKRNNVLIFGVKYDNKQNSLAEFVIQKINQWLELDLTLECLNNVYPIGKTESNRPILIQFQSYLTKTRVLKECRKLKGTGISITEDLTKEDREIQKKLIKHKKQAQSKGYKTYIRRNKLYVNNEEYTIEDLEEKDREEQPEIPQDQSLEQRKVNSAPATPVIENIIYSEEESDEDTQTNEVKGKKDEIATKTQDTTVRQRENNEENFTTKKRKTATLYDEESAKKKCPIEERIFSKTRKINTRSVNK